MRLFRVIDKIISLMESAFLGVGIIACSFILFFDVLLRYVFLKPLFWSEELVRYLMVWMVFIGASVIVKKGGHVAVDVLPIFLPPTFKRILERIIPFVAIAFCLVLFYFSWKHTVRIKQSGQITTAMEAPMWTMYLAIPVGSLMMAIRWTQLSISRWVIKKEAFLEKTEQMD
jgi:C4-dicarboxylate transporter, DctQ subunit